MIVDRELLEREIALSLNISLKQAVQWVDALLARQKQGCDHRNTYRLPQVDASGIQCWRCRDCGEAITPVQPIEGGL